MKKLLLFVAAASIAGGASGQALMTAAPTVNNHNKAAAVRSLTARNHTGSAAFKTTAGGDRWYNYVDYLDTVSSLGFETLRGSIIYLWNDTSSINYYSGGTYDWNTYVSYGATFHPSFFRPTNVPLTLPDSGFNDYNLYPGALRVGKTDAYAVDSLAIFGFYRINPAKTSVVDTLRVTFVQGTGKAGPSVTDVFNGGSLSGTSAAYGVDPLRFVNIRYDSTKNTATGILTGASAPRTVDYYISSANWGDTFANGLFVAQIGLSSPFNVPAGGMVGVSITFKSGDATYPSTGDTVNTGSGYKYNMFTPLIYARGTSTTYQFARFDSSDRNQGLFKTLPNTSNGWGNQFIPMWAWSSSGGGSSLQYPYMSWHVTCATCGVVVEPNSVNTVSVISGVDVYPNPANSELSISFAQTEASDATVTLTNIVGQVVAATDLKAAKSTTAVFNTSKLTPGLYLYTINAANGARTTGRVVVAH